MPKGHGAYVMRRCVHLPVTRRLITAGPRDTDRPRWGLLECSRCGARRRVLLYPPGSANRYYKRELAEPIGGWMVAR